jgi:secondary thiamine-phosphate synthase enzyme
MHTLESAACRHLTIQIATEGPTQFIDVTDRIQSLVDRSGVQTGFVNVQSLHTTTAIVVNEHEPLLLADFGSQLERMAPVDAPYAHDDMRRRTTNLVPGERANGHAHCRALFLSPSACLNVVSGRIQLGRWQRIFLVELDGPRSRDLSVVIVGEAAR